MANWQAQLTVSLDLPASLTQEEAEGGLAWIISLLPGNAGARVSLTDVSLTSFCDPPDPRCQLCKFTVWASVPNTLTVARIEQIAASWFSRHLAGRRLPGNVAVTVVATDPDGVVVNPTDVIPFRVIGGVDAEADVGDLTAWTSDFIGAFARTRVGRVRPVIT